MRSLLNVINTIDRVLSAFIKPLVVVLSLLIAFLMVTGIFSREIIGQPLLGLEEVILTSVMWLYMMGAALASQERTHLRGDFIQVITRDKKTLARLRLLAELITFVMAIVFSIWAYSLLSWGLERQQSTAVLRIPLYVAQSSLFVCSVLMVFYSLRALLRDTLSMSDEEKT